LSVEKAEAYGISFERGLQVSSNGDSKIETINTTSNPTPSTKEICLDETMLTDATTDPTDETAQLSLRLREWFRYVVTITQLSSLALSDRKHTILTHLILRPSISPDTPISMMHVEQPIWPAYVGVSRLGFPMNQKANSQSVVTKVDAQKRGANVWADSRRANIIWPV
jgi:hypothetical protein